MDAETCVKCGKKGVFHFRALTVRTIHLREMKGERRVQGLGGFTDFSVCADCALDWLDDVLKPGKALAARLIPFAAIMLVGAVLAVLFTFGGNLSAGLGQWAEDGVLRLFGLAALVCGALGLFGNLCTFADTRRSIPRCPPRMRWNRRRGLWQAKTRRRNPAMRISPTSRSLHGRWR